MNRQRLEILIDVLKKVEASHADFNMGNWIARTPCGTSACAAGYAALDPRFQAMGLTLNTRTGPLGEPIRSIDEYNALAGDDEAYWEELVTEIWYEGYRNYLALSRFFYTTVNTADYLFNPARYDHDAVTPHEVIDRIETLLNEESN